MARTRKYRDLSRTYPSRHCEHCDGENSNTTRDDYLRGHICPVCDDALDRMEAEEKPEPEEQLQ